MYSNNPESDLNAVLENACSKVSKGTSWFKGAYKAENEDGYYIVIKYLDNDYEFHFCRLKTVSSELVIFEKLNNSKKELLVKDYELEEPDIWKIYFITFKNIDYQRKYIFNRIGNNIRKANKVFFKECYIWLPKLVKIMSGICFGVILYMWCNCWKQDLRNE